VTLIQSTDGVFRLAGGLLAFYWFNQTEYATAVGLVAAGMIFSLIVLGVFRRQFEFRNVVGTSVGHIKYKQEFSSYFRKMFVVMILNASVIHLDKWLLFVLLGAEGMGKYAVVYMLAMTITSVMYVFFEMLGFPLIINRDSSIRRKQYLLLLLLAYAVCLLIIVTIIHLFGEALLLFLTTGYVAGEYESFTLLVVACGLLNFGRIAMVQGQVDKQPQRYWPAYLILLCFFISWCVLFVELGDGRVAA
jgi:O-antigen/teichoic acid export membrane protein